MDTDSFQQALMKANLVGMSAILKHAEETELVQTRHVADNKNTKRDIPRESGRQKTGTCEDELTFAVFESLFKSVI